MAISNFIGGGIGFPVELNSNGSVDILTGREIINSSIKMILGWESSRIMLPEFGSRYQELLEEPNDELLMDLVIFFTFEALETWEKRITVLDVIVSDLTESQMSIQVRYNITNTNLEEVLTYPFYRELIS
jgi:phage baseplate assembly protein W